MPVLILAGPGELPIVRGLAEKLREEGGEVRCYLEDDDHDLRNIGCKIAVGSLDDELNIEGALFNVHTFIPLLPDPLSIGHVSGAAELERVGLAIVGSAAEANIEQTILPLSGISRTGGPIGSAYAKVGEAFSEVVSPLCTLITGLLWGDEQVLPAVIGELDPGDDRQLPILSSEDLISALAAADDLENLEGTWELGGESRAPGQLAPLEGNTKAVVPPALLEWLESGLKLRNDLEQMVSATQGSTGR